MSHDILKAPETALARLREKRGKTQSELAIVLGMSQVQISRLESGQQNLKPRHAKKLAEILECDWLELIEEDRLSLSPQEDRLIDLYRSMSETNRGLGMQLFEAMARGKLDGG